MRRERRIANRGIRNRDFDSGSSGGFGWFGEAL